MTTDRNIDITPPEESVEGTTEKAVQPAQATPSSEDIKKQIETKDAEYQTKLKQFEDNWKRAERNLSHRESELRRLRQEAEDRQTDREYMKILAASIAELKAQSPEQFEQETKQRAPDLLKQFEALEQKRTMERRQQELVQKVSTYQEKVEALGLTEDANDYWDLKEMVEGGQFAKADVRIARIEKQKAAKAPEQNTKPANNPEKPAGSDEERILKAAEQLLRDKGLLTQEVPAPGAASSKLAEAEEKYISGDMTLEEYSKIRKQSGL